MPLSQWLNYRSIFAVAVFYVLSSASAANLQASQETLEQLQQIKASMDRRADPCDDFYTYACGNWTQYPPNEGYFSMDPRQRYTYTTALQEVIATKYPHRDQIKRHNQTFIDKALTLYYSCKEATFVNFFEHISPSEELEWPLYAELYNTSQVAESSEQFRNFDVFSLLSQLLSIGCDRVIFRMWMGRDLNGTIGLSVLTPEQIEFDSYETLSTIFDMPPEMLEKYYAEIQETHRYWQSIYKRYTEQEDIAKFSYAEIKRQYPRFGQFLADVLPNQLRDHDTVDVLSLNYIRFMFAKQWTAAEAQKLCNYIMMQYFTYMKNNFIKNIDELLQKRMYMAVNYMYHQHIYMHEAKQFNAGLIDWTKKIFTHLMAIVNENNLKLTPKQLEAVKEKIFTLNTNVGNLPENVDFDVVDQHYSQLADFEIDNCGANVILVLKQRTLEQINCPQYVRCGDDVVASPYNIPEMNLLVHPFSTLSTPFYHWSFDPIFAVSLLGTLIGHEVTHSIDTDALVSWKLFDLLTDEFENHPHIREAVDCLQRQEPSEYMRERVSDLLGARAAYRVYRKEYNVQPNFTNIPWQQLFFLNLAQFFCGTKTMIAIDHDPHGVRMHQIAMNMVEFAEAFQCPVGSKMNPAEKCRFY